MLRNRSEEYERQVQTWQSKYFTLMKNNAQEGNSQGILFLGRI